MAELEDPEVTQLRRMLECVSEVRRGTRELGDGADTLLYLLNGLRRRDPEWVRELTARIAELEQANLLPPAQRRTQGRSFEGKLRQTLHDLERLIREKLPQAGPVPPPARA